VNPFAALYDFYNGIPAPIREPARSAVVSSAWGLQGAVVTLIGAAAADGQAGSPGSTWHYLLLHWWGAALGIILPAYYRAQQGFKASTQTVSTSSSVSVPQPPPPAKIVEVSTVVDPRP